MSVDLWRDCGVVLLGFKIFIYDYKIRREKGLA